MRPFKKLSMVLLLLGALLAAAPAARAWVIHNRLDYELGVKRNWSLGFAKYKVPPKATYNGEAQAPLANVFISYIAHGDYFESNNFSIPAGGAAWVEARRVKVYSAGHRLLRSVGMESYSWR